MKISGAYIDGFGFFHDQPISGLNRDRLLFYGHNEAGKSTMLGFIRSVLFGFPRANSKDATYPPVCGGVHGGRIDFLTTTGETWSVSRKPGKGGGVVTVTGSDGSVHDKTMLDQLLGGISYEAFRSIMAFGLSELQTMETLSGEHITGAIYGAGLGTSMNAMPRALKQIRKRMDDLFKNRASNPPVNKIAGELDRIRKALLEASLQAGRYDAVVDGLAKTEKEAEALREKLSDCRREQRRYESMERLWPDWITYTESHQALGELGSPVETFPEDGLEALETLVEKRDRLEKAFQEIKRRHEQISNQLTPLPVDEKLLDIASDIAFLVENRNTYLEKASNLPMKIREAEAHAEKVHQLLSRLGGEWSEKTVLDFDRSLFTRENIRGHQETLDSLDRKIVAAETLLSDKNAAANQAADLCRLAEKDLAEVGDMPPRRNPEPIQRLREGRDRLLDALAEHQRQTVMLSDANDELNRLQQAAEAKSPGKNWPSFLICAVGAVAAGILIWLRKYNEAAMTFVATLAAIWGARVHRRQQQQIYLNHQEMVRRQQKRTDEITTRVRQLESTHKNYAQLAAAAGAVETIDVQGEAIPDALDRFFSLLSEEERRRESVTRALRHLEEKKASEDAARRALEKTTSDLGELQKQRQDAKTAWADRCRCFGLSDTLSPATALEALDVIEETLENLQQRERYKAEAACLESDLSKYRKTARRILSDLSWPAATDDDLPRIVGELMSRLEESRGNQRERDALGRQITDMERQMADTRKDLSAAKASIRHLLETIDVADETAFRKVGGMERRRRELLAAVRSSEGNMRRISGEIDTTGLLDKLGALSLADVTARKEVADEGIRRYDAELSDLYARRAELRQTLETLSTSEDIARLRAREASLFSDLSQHARDWSRHAVAEHLILRAREVYERKHQPEIIQDAGEIFSRMTDGKYQGVVSPLGENTIMAVDRNRERILPEHLSRGTAEQLYLAVRFSYIRHQARKSDPLPVVMDDILVNFDPVRARKAAEAIVDLSASHQVLMFTCHPETVDVFQEIDPGLPVFTMDGGRIVSPDHSLTSEKSKTA